MNAATASTTEQGPHRRRAVGAFLTLALSLATIAISATGAVFTDTDTHDADFATGSVDLGQSYAGDQVLAASNMAPGDAVTQAVTVENTGSLELRYAVTSTSTEDVLAAQLAMWVWEEDAATDGCDAAPTDVTTHLYGPDDLGSTAGTAVVGDPAQGPDAGDRVLAASTSEVLCFHVELPLDTGNAHQDSSTTATFEFRAEQTANNS